MASDSVTHEQLNAALLAAIAEVSESLIDRDAGEFTVEDLERLGGGNYTDARNTLRRMVRCGKAVAIKGRQAGDGKRSNVYRLTPIDLTPWIGVDLDGTLAMSLPSWTGRVGEPIAPMIKKVKAWLAEGQHVKIFTSRVGVFGGYSKHSGRVADIAFAKEQTKIIEDWCEKHIGQRLPVTAVKDFCCIGIYDDIAFRVEKDTGKISS